MTDLDDPRTLVGAWRVVRTIDDRRSGELHDVDGDLVIADDAMAVGDLVWEEQLVWHRPDGDTAVRRGLRLREDSDGWWVLFEDGRAFHPWRPGERVVHPCDPDTYTGLVEATADGWRVTWEVTGPAKDYTMVTTLTGLRAAAQPA